MNNKVYLVTVARLENLYIKEWVDHHLNLNIDKIIIYDNNNDNEEKIEDVIKSNNHVQIINNFRNAGTHINGIWFQSYIFTFAYYKYSDECDWIIFIDADEFIILDQKYKNNIKNFLSDNIFDNYDCIRLNWKIYDDNDLIYYENKPLKERFTRISKNNEQQVKSIYRTNKKIKILSPHGKEIPKLKSCNCEGKECNYPKGNICGEWIDYPSYKNAWINHYRFKTIEEFMMIKIRVNPVCQSRKNKIEPFFMYNIKTKEKLEYLKMFKKQLWKHIKNS